MMTRLVSPEKTALLGAIDAYNWRLDSAFGRESAASAIPPILHGLASNNAATRRDALLRALELLWHQGTIYEASGHAVPFLVRMLALPDLSGEELLEATTLLATLALSARGVREGESGCGSPGDARRIESALSAAREAAGDFIERGSHFESRRNILVALMQLPEAALSVSDPALAAVARQFAGASYDEAWQTYDDFT